MRNINELIGIINGISYDGIINKLEVAGLSSWVKNNRNLSYEPRQARLISLVEQVLKDRIITDEEREMLIDNCRQYAALETDSSAKIYELDGIIEGVIYDNEINEKEVCRLREWMRTNESFIRDHEPSKIICEKIDQILEDGIVTQEEQETLIEILKKRINNAQIDMKIGYLKTCVKERKNLGIDLIDLLDNAEAIAIIHNRAERELGITLNSYSGTYVHDPEIVFVSLVLIGMLYYDGAFYESVRKTYKNLYHCYSEQKVEGLIRTLLNNYRIKDDVTGIKTRIINVVLAGSIVPSYYLGAFFEFIYDIYKLNFNSDLPDDLYGEFQFVYDGLQNLMSSESDELQVDVTKKTYKLIKSTKLLITNPVYNDAVIKLSIIIVRLIDKYIWNKDNALYNPYLKRGYEEWLSTINREKDYVHRSKSARLRSRWEPEYVLNGNTIYLVPPIHRVKATYDYRNIRIIVNNEENVIYDDYVEDIREIIGGYQIKNPSIELSNPLGRIVYQLVAGNEVIYESKTRLHRNFIVFDERGQEQANNKDYSGTAVFCTKSKVDKLHLYFSGEAYCLSSYSAHLGDAVLIDDKVFNFSEMIRPGVFGEKHDGYFVAQADCKFEVFKDEIFLVFESEATDSSFEIQINQHAYKMNAFEYSTVERKGVNKYSLKLDCLDAGIYQLRVNALHSGKKINVLRTQFAIDKNLRVEQVENSKNSYIVSVDSDLMSQPIFDEISIQDFREDWIKFNWNNQDYIYYVPFQFPLYRIDNGDWRPFSQEVWIGDITQDSSIDLYGCKYDKICLLPNAGQIIEEVPGLKNEGVFSRFSAGFLLSYKPNYDCVGIMLVAEERVQEAIWCYNKCILDDTKTTVIYSHEAKALVVMPCFYGQGNIRFKIIDDEDNVVYTSSALEKGVQENVYDLSSFINYKVIFFEKERGLSLKKEHILKEFPIVFYAREDFLGKSFKIKEVYFDQFVRGEFLRKRHYFNTTYVYFKEMISGNEYIGEVYVRTYNGAFMLDNINPVDIEICSDVIDGMIELSITKDGDGLLLDFDHYGIMNSMDDGKAVDIFSYNIDMKGVESV